VIAAFHLSPLIIQWYSIMLEVAVITAILLGFKEAKRRGQSSEHVINMALFVLPLGIIGARLYQVINGGLSQGG
jgi:phosphatidylglycerol:prolipoprotein diacylglycerol transferase